MKMRFNCPKCRAAVQADWSPGDPPRVGCSACSAEAPLDVGPALGEHNQVERCPLCSGRELYRRKDFPQGLGFGIVILAGILSFYSLWRREIVLAWAFPLAALAIDAVLYFFVGYAVCCYRCSAEFVGTERHPVQGAFDLATAEKYMHD
jgi:DNA-directed RNA polymerase subunit RPC12/RpoP